MSLRKSLGLGLMLLAFLVLLVIVRHTAILSLGLMADDLMYVPAAIAGEPVYIKSGRMFFDIFNPLLATSETVISARALLLFMLALAATTWVVVLQQAGIPILAGGTYLAAAILAPYLTLQGLFVNGSHPTLGLFFATFALASSTQISSSTWAKALFWLGLTLLSFWATGLSSPIFWLVPLAMLVPCLYFLTQKSYRNTVLYLVAALVPGLLLLADGASNHYGDMGWVDYDPMRAIARAIERVYDVAIELFVGRRQLAVFITAAILAPLSLLAIKRTEKTQREANPNTLSQHPYLFAFMFATAAALAFGPAAAVLKDTDRYYVASLVLIAPAFALVVESIFANQPIANRFLRITAFGMALVWGYATFTKIETKSAPSLARQHDASVFLRSVESSWPEDSQVLLLLDNYRQGWSSGFNHWSTWFVRYAANRPDVIGLIGSTDMIQEDPFYDSYAHHGPQYWSVDTTGRAYRKKMVGLVKNRPLFAYKIQEDGQYQEVDIAKEKSSNRYDMLRHGGTPETDWLELGSLVNLCTSISDNKTVLLPMGVQTDTTSEPMGRILEVANNSSAKVTLNPTNIAELNVSFKLQSRSVVQPGVFSETQPPMPFKSDFLVIYQVADNAYQINTIKVKKTLVVEENRALNIDHQVVAGCGSSTKANDVYWSELHEGKLGRSMQIGKGYKERFWSGTIGDFEILERDKQGKQRETTIQQNDFNSAL